MEFSKGISFITTLTPTIEDGSDLGDSLNTSLIDLLRNQRPLNKRTENIFLVVYGILLAIAALGNTLVCLAVINNDKMRTSRNLLIFNLAISDLILAIFTSPFNMVHILSFKWTFGTVLCKTVRSFQAVNVFVSTLSITAIAVDRYHIIIHPLKRQQKLAQTAVVLPSIWLCAGLMASPLFIFTRTKKLVIERYDLYLYDYCAEEWPIPTGALIYSVGSMLFQYIFPTSLVTFTHYRILRRLESRLTGQNALALGPEPHARYVDNSKEVQRRLPKSSVAEAKWRANKRRQRKTHTLLVCMGLLFAISWAPLNLQNIMTEAESPLLKNPSINFTLLYAVCSLFALSSACVNPILYAFLNENFKREFRSLFIRGCRVLSKYRRSSGNRRVSAVGKSAVRLGTTFVEPTHYEPSFVLPTQETEAPPLVPTQGDKVGGKSNVKECIISTSTLKDNLPLPPFQETYI